MEGIVGILYFSGEIFLFRKKINLLKEKGSVLVYLIGIIYFLYV